jgi:hypothetical protein
LAVAIALLALQLIGLVRSDDVLIQIGDRRVIIDNMPYHILVTTFRMDAPSGFWWERNPRVIPRGGYAVPAAYVVSYIPGYRLAIPHWLIFLLTAPWPLWWLARHRKQATRRRRGLCPQCGYDLRASADRCPECGSEFRGLGPPPASREPSPMHPAAQQHACAIG